MSVFITRPPRYTPATALVEALRIHRAEYRRTSDVNRMGAVLDALGIVLPLDRLEIARNMEFCDPNGTPWPGKGPGTLRPFWPTLEVTHSPPPTNKTE